MLLPLAGRKIRAAGAAAGHTAVGPEQGFHRVRPGAGRARLHNAAAGVGTGRAGHIVAVRTGPAVVAGCRSHRDEAGRRSYAVAVVGIHPAGAANVPGEHCSRLAEEGKASVRGSG